jgi:hypothetical protein
MAQRVEQLNWVEQVDRNYWTGYLTALTLPTMVQGEIEALRNQPYPGFAGDSAPICKRARATFNPSGLRGKALIEAWYETKRKPGKARLVTRTRPQYVKMAVDVEGNVIEGPSDMHDPDGNPLYFRVTKGNDTVQDYETTITLQTAYMVNEYNLGNVYALRRCVNDSGLTIIKLGGIAAGSLLCLGVDTDFTFGDDMVDVDYILAWSGPAETWNQQTESTGGIWAPVKRPEIQDGAATGRFKDVLEFQLGKVITGGALVAAVPSSRKKFKTANFTILQGLSSW